MNKVVRCLTAVLIAIAVGTTSCKKEKPSSISSMTLDGQQYSFQEILLESQGKDTINLSFTFKRNGYALLSESFLYCPLLKGKQILMLSAGSNLRPCQSSLFAVDDDIVADVFQVWKPDSLNSYIEFVTIDAASGHLAGNYQCTYVRDTSRTKFYPDIADTLVVKAGRFDIYQKW